MSAHILVIAVDGLRASALGAYGNTWYETPHLDRLAAESMLSEWCFANAVTLPEVYRALWYGEHPLRAGSPTASLPQRLRGFGYHTRLLTDEAQLAELAGAADFDAIDVLTSDEAEVAGDVADTRATWLMAAAAEAIQAIEKPQLVWLHAKGMYGAWDAPLALRASFADEDEGDVSVYEGLMPPDTQIDCVADPDARFRYACAYAAQVQVFDAALGGLLQELRRPDRPPWHLLIVGTRGFPLGEHGRVGGLDQRLCGEQLQVPLLVIMPGRNGALERIGELTEHADVAATVLAWAGDSSSQANAVVDGLPLQSLLSTAEGWRDRSVAMHHSDNLALRTAHWCWRGKIERAAGVAGTEPTASSEALFVRPDDRWEANDVVQLRADVAGALRAAIVDFETHCQHPDHPPLSPLDELLLEPVH